MSRIISRSALVNMDDNLSARWDFMRPWCAPLRGKFYLHQVHVSRVPSYSSTSLSVLLRETPERTRAIRDALVLLSMIARVDRRAWYVASTHCGANIKNQESDTESAEFDPARLMAHLDDGDRLTSFFSDLDDPPTAQFEMAARKIASYSVCCRS